MCSIGVTNIKRSILDSNNFSQYRGPDYTNVVEANGVQFMHNLLHLTGQKTPQPFIKDNVYVVFNGEIYNYLEFGNYKTDGECLINLYQLHGDEFTKLLDGEFALCLIDFNLEKILISNDTFSCKPLWYSFKNSQFCIGSYESQLTMLGFDRNTKLYANKTKVFNLKTLDKVNEFDNFKFDLNQHKTNFNDWCRAFTNSIEKRIRGIQYGVYLGLSSGYDSGAIACELLKQNVSFKSYTIAGPENQSIINSRVNLIPSHEIIYLTKDEYDTTKQYILRNCENFSYNDKFLNYNIKGDKASVGLAFICNKAKKENYRIYLSGQGADEIISDYGFNGNKIYGHSSFGGRFPSKLDGFFPWHSFYDGTQIQYLNKEEYIAGHYGIETRYPFLDKFLVQEFLWLTSDLKNSRYKSVLSYYLRSNNFPFAEEKIGFNVLKGLK